MTASPPLVGSEVELLRAFGDHFRQTLLRQASGLTRDQLNTPLPPSNLTLAGMLKHLAFVDNYWLRHVLAGEDPVEPWASADWDADPDWEWHSAALDSPEELFSLVHREIAYGAEVLDRVIAAGGLDALAARARGGQPVSVRWILLHLVEEYARHAGHADLIRESIDGATDC